MTTVKRRIGATKQPRGGYINPRALDVRQLDDGAVLHAAENVHASITGAAVDYLTRLANGTPVEDAFDASLRGATNLELRGVPVADDVRAALSALVPGVLPDAAAVAAACRLAGYDVAYRAGVALYNPDVNTEPDAATTGNIQTMVTRAQAFFSEYGPVTLSGFTFDGAYTDLVTSGDGDFLTVDTLWDFKVSVSKPTNAHTLQLLMYFLMGKRSGQPEFETITHLGVFNPRLNTVYRIALADVPTTVISEVSTEVIGYAD